MNRRKHWHIPGASAQKDAMSLLYIISQHETRGCTHAGHWGPGLSAASRLSQLHLAIGKLGSQEVESPLPQLADRSTLEQQGLWEGS